MLVGVIGSGSIGPDLAYGFASALARSAGSRVFLTDIRAEALEAGMQRIRGYIGKAVARGKLSSKAAASLQDILVPTLKLQDLAQCDYVLEAATEDLNTKRAILAEVENTVRPDCLLGFATSGLPRARIAAHAKHPERCFVNHPFFPAWRALPIEVVLSGNEALGDRMIQTLRTLGKVPIVTADAVCFAADDVFCNYCAEAARIVEEGLATPEQVDRIVDAAIGGGGPFLVMDLTKGNLLNVHCLELMKDAPTGSAWFTPPESFRKQANKPWLDKAAPRSGAFDEALRTAVLDRILAVLLGRTYFVVDQKICDASDMNWLTRTALGFRQGLLDLAESIGAERVHAICTAYAAAHPGYAIPPSIADKRLARFLRNVQVQRQDRVGTIVLRRPEVKNALNDLTMAELQASLAQLAADKDIDGVVITSWDGAIAGADIQELAALRTEKEAQDKCLRGQAVLEAIETCPKPVVAAVDGPVLGGGAELSHACHARVVGPSLQFGQPEVNLGIIPGYGGTQRLPRLIGIERALDLLRTGRSVGAREAHEWGWASIAPPSHFVQAAKALIRDHAAGKVRLAPVSTAAMQVGDKLPTVDIGHRSRAIDAILVEAVKQGVSRPLREGLAIEAAAFARCKQTVDMGIGMTSFLQNGPRVPAAFLHE